MVLRLTFQTLIWVVFTGALIFAAAGTPVYPGAWVLLLELAAFGVGIGLWLARHDPHLLRERMGSLVQSRQAALDRVLTAAIFVTFYAWFAFAAYDAVRVHPLTDMAWLQALGAALIAVCFYVAYLTFRENSFAAPVVKIQQGQHVVDTGPYAIIRHPMYAGAIAFFLGVPLLLGSLRAMAIVPIMVLGLMARVLIEEHTLSKDLPGYANYKKRVRFRLVPFVW